jgi:hypothetical protein
LRRRDPSAARRAATPDLALALAATLLLAGCAAGPGTVAPTRPLPVNLPGSAGVGLAFGGDPDALIGREAAEIRRALGPPQLVRRDAPAEIWQYRTQACVLDLFLYEEARELRVAYLEARDQEARAVPARPCFASVLAAQRIRQSS